MNHMPPGQIILLLQIHCFGYREQLTILDGSPAAEKFIKRLLRDELIYIVPRCHPPGDVDQLITQQTLDERERSPFNTTDRGRALIEKWGNTELPVLVETWT
jgi:hypothetical protein